MRYYSGGKEFKEKRMGEFQEKKVRGIVKNLSCLLRLHFILAKLSL
jgi:hypothetical protein